MSDVQPEEGQSEVQEGGWPPGWVSSEEELTREPEEGEPEE